MPSKLHEKIVEPLERAYHEMKGAAEGATATHATPTTQESAFSQGAKHLAQKILPEATQEKLGLKETTFTERAFNFVERNVLGRPLAFVALPLIIGLFVSSWVHKRIRGNRAAFDKISVPNNVPPSELRQSSWLYDPMWTVALTCMGYASWLIYDQGGFGEWLSLSFYNMSLFLLAAWPILFFGFTESHKVGPLASVPEMLPPLCATLLSINTFITMALFYAKNSVAGSLMIPATLWIGYMTVINWQVYNLNKGRFVGLSEKKEEKYTWTSTAPGAATAALGGEREVKKTR